MKVVNDAAMQALGSYKGGKMLFLGLGTGLGSTLIVDGIVEPMELGHLPYRKRTYEDYVGVRGLRAPRQEEVAAHVADVVERLVAALEPDDVVLGGGNVKQLKKLPPGCRAGDNANAFVGGFRLWRGDRTKRRASASSERTKGCTMTAAAAADRPAGLEGAPGALRERSAACTCASSSPTTRSAASA